MFLILVSSTDNYNELKRYSHWGLKWIACVELLHRPCQHIPVVAASAVLHQTQTLHTIRHLASHSFYKYCTNRSHNGWNVICKNVQISTNGDEIMVMYKLNMPYEMNIKYIYISSLFLSISVPRLLLKKEMFMRSCWLSRRSRAVLTWSTVRIFPLTYIHTYLHTRDMYLLFPKHCPVAWMSSFLHRKN